ncbi:MAG: non-canonical purine NTP pyrophosphatase [Candidatus Pacebacteria bacterium]|nr:non-canonical purine NTP pyrophosphatase [Candidatus Paceibacterota bacterium]MBP9772830.1 non-canonical purine NTP pyrophosphatase [Candidatus Paceibacterota bacterium]
MNIVLSTRNVSKAEQIKTIFSGSLINIDTLDEAGIKGEAVEDGETLKENAFKKAIFALAFAEKGSWVMAEDTGIFIDALDGAPGIISARWAGEGKSTLEIMEYCLSKMKGIKNRKAYFETVVALVSPQGKEYFFIGKVYGILLDTPRTAPQPSMPYSSIFIPNGQDKTWAEMSLEEENKISHRGKAFRQALVFLQKF